MGCHEPVSMLLSMDTITYHKTTFTFQHKLIRYLEVILHEQTMVCIVCTTMCIKTQTYLTAQQRGTAQ
jgi:hypothetical protein